MRLGHYFGTSAAFWLQLQNRYDLDVAEDELGDCLERAVLPREAAAWNYHAPQSRETSIIMSSNSLSGGCWNVCPFPSTRARAHAMG